MSNPFASMKNQAPRPFPGVVHDLSQERPVILPAQEMPDAGRAAGLRAARDREMVVGAQGELMDVCIRPKEQRLFAWKVWPVQYVGSGRVMRLPGGGIDFTGVKKMTVVWAPIGVRIAWNLIGAPVWHAGLACSWLRRWVRGKLARGE